MGLEGYGDLALMNMVRKGLLGDVLHAEGGYVPVEFPDFTKRKWKTATPFDIG